MASAGTTVTTRARLAVCAPLVTCTVKLLVPTVVGVPESAPLESSVRPAGSDPLSTPQFAAPLVPMARSVSRYGWPTIPSASAAVVTASAAATVAVRLRVADCAPLVTCTVTFATPAAVGIPESTPLAASVSPAGSVPAVTDQA